MAGFYVGEAVIVVDGDEIPVHARLTVEGPAAMRGWGGVLRADPGTADLRSVQQADEPRVRLPDGREAAFLLQPDADLETGLTISGSGTPLF
jgi:hypothetical protein